MYRENHHLFHRETPQSHPHQCKHLGYIPLFLTLYLQIMTFYIFVASPLIFCLNQTAVAHENEA